MNKTDRVRSGTAHKFIFTLLLGLVFCMSFFLRAHAELPTNDGIILSFSCGFKNIVRTGRNLPFDVTVNNRTGADITDGRLIIEVPAGINTGFEFEECRVKYSFPVSAAAGEKVRIRDTISLSDGSEPVVIGLYDSSGQLLASVQKKVSISSDSACLLTGVLSDTPERLEYLKGVPLQGSGLVTRTAELSPEDIPDSEAGLKQLDVLLISNFALDQLDGHDIRVIEEWTANGGVLLIGTGRRKEAAELFGRVAGEISIGELESRQINMGMKYSKSGPDGAVIELPVRDISAPDGLEVMQSEDTAMLTRMNYGSGIIGITAYDFCDTGYFCSEEMEYTADIFLSLLGSSRLKQIAEMNESGSVVYRNAEKLFGMLDTEGLPDTLVFVIFAAAYVLLTGVGLHMYLKSRGLEIYYHAFVPFTAFAAAFIFLILSAGARKGGSLLDAAFVREIHDDGDMTENGFIRMMNTTEPDYRLSVAGEYEFAPVLPDRKADAAVNRQSYAVLDRTEEGIKLTADGLRAFSEGYYEYSVRHEEAGEVNLSSNISMFDGEVSGFVTNEGRKNLRNAVVFAGGRVIPVGDIRAGESVELDSKPVLVLPFTSGSITAAALNRLMTADAGSGRSDNNDRRSELLAYYLDKAAGIGRNRDFAVAFIEDAVLPEGISIGTDMNERVLGMAAAYTGVNYHKNLKVWRNACDSEISVISGEYDDRTNSAQNTVVLEFKIGNDISVSSISFAGLSREGESSSIGRFAGMLSIYNYRSGSYDQANPSEGISSAERISAYISPANTLTLRYTPSEGLQGGTPMFLPLPEFTGYEKNDISSHD